LYYLLRVFKSEPRTEAGAAPEIH
ncbi:MAG: hypothetical protein JWP91_3202, partial [Fibrobacteres bacterium]|nr:hypothetical protein [Fibrobacterota bacterium]